ncbi:MAG: S1C family serine protease, partial [Limisphaerales bacterium]
MNEMQNEPAQFPNRVLRGRLGTAGRKNVEGRPDNPMGVVRGSESSGGRLGLWYRDHRLSLAGFAAALPLVFLLASTRTGDANEQVSGMDLVRQLNQTFADVAQQVSSNVVVINITQRPAAFQAEGDDDGSTNGFPPGFWQHFHEQFQRPAPEETMGQGSGVIIRRNGYILTNGHVVEDADTIQVRLQDGRTFPATVRGVDAQSDIAVVKIDADALPVAKFADSSKTRVGEFAIAVGTPFSLDYSVTFGHVSAKGRSHVLDGPEGAMMD